jgi:2-aminoadipate transaminase
MLSPDAINSSGATMSGGCPSQFTATALTSIISDGTLDARIERLKYVYSQRVKVYAAAIEKYWDEYGVKYNPCVGGYFFWIKLPEGITAAEASREALADGVWIMEGTSCMVPNDTSVEYNKYIRICIALEEEDRAVEGIKRLGKVFRRLLKRK